MSEPKSNTTPASTVTRPASTALPRAEQPLVFGRDRGGQQRPHSFAHYASASRFGDKWYDDYETFVAPRGRVHQWSGLGTALKAKNSKAEVHDHDHGGADMCRSRPEDRIETEFVAQRAPSSRSPSRAGSPAVHLERSPTPPSPELGKFVTAISDRSTPSSANDPKSHVDRGKSIPKVADDGLEWGRAVAALEGMSMADKHHLAFSPPGLNSKNANNSDKASSRRPRSKDRTDFKRREGSSLQPIARGRSPSSEGSVSSPRMRPPPAFPPLVPLASPFPPALPGGRLTRADFIPTLPIPTTYPRPPWDGVPPFGNFAPDYKMLYPEIRDHYVPPPPPSSTRKEILQFRANAKPSGLPAHPSYNYADATMAFLVDGIEYRVHRYLFEQGATSIFKEQLPTHSFGVGKQLLTVTLMNVRKPAFDALLAEVYRSSSDDDAVTDLSTMESVFALTTRFGLYSVCNRAMKKYEETCTPVNRIIAAMKFVECSPVPAPVPSSLAGQFNTPYSPCCSPYPGALGSSPYGAPTIAKKEENPDGKPDWKKFLLEALKELCIHEVSIDEPDAVRLGLANTVRIWGLQWELRKRYSVLRNAMNNVPFVSPNLNHQPKKPALPFIDQYNMNQIEATIKERFGF